MPIRVIVVEDHPLVLESITSRLANEEDIQVVGTATHGSQLLSVVREKSPDVVVLDIGMSTGHFEPITAVKAVRRAYPDTQILVFTGYDDGMWVRGLIEAGALGYVLKSDGLALHLPEGVREVHAGRRFYSPSVSDKYLSCGDVALLTDTQAAVLWLVAQGLSNAAIGEQMGITEKTISNYLSTIYGKLDIQGGAGTNRRVAAINKARDMGILPED
jgi:DNA-binding NarL/FixJ family response regulator